MSDETTAALASGDTVRLRVPGAHPEHAIEVRPRAAEHEVLGLCDVVARPNGPPLARFQAVDWRHPRAIPAMDRPAAVPPGAGSAILNLLAGSAAARPSQPLRYVGPYPTNALLQSLLTCFRVEAPVTEARERFTAGVEELAVSGVMREIPVDFWPDPFTRIWHEGGPGVAPVCIQMRRGVDAVYIGQRGYRRETTGVDPRRVRADSDGSAGGSSWQVVIEMGGQVWARIARVSDDGALLEGPHPVPSVTNALCGTRLPPGIHRALLAALPERAPRLLRPALVHVLTTTPLSWADTGDTLARHRDGGVQVHAALPEVFAESAALALLDTIVRAVEPVFQRLAQARVADSFASPDPNAG